jgi:ribonuclease E
MDEGKNNRAVEKKLKDCLKDDRARVQMGKISPFGLMEISRQRPSRPCARWSSKP